MEMFYNEQTNPLGWELGGTGVIVIGTGDRGLRLGDVLQLTNNPLGWELGGKTWRISTMNKQQPYHLGWELGGTGILGLGPGTGDLDVEIFYNEQTTTLPFRLGTGGDWDFRAGDRGLGT